MYGPSGELCYRTGIVYECTPKCASAANCRNRNVQHGVHASLQVFRTAKKGWGVRALHALPRGSFVCEYAGEVIRDDEAERRANDDGYILGMTWLPRLTHRADTATKCAIDIAAQVARNESKASTITRADDALATGPSAPASSGSPSTSSTESKSSFAVV